jgi:hypothetical protein
VTKSKGCSTEVGGENSSDVFLQNSDKVRTECRVETSVGGGTARSVHGKKRADRKDHPTMHNGDVEREERKRIGG